MQFVIYRFHFSVGVHFGAGSLWDGMNTLPADTLFSALCHEAAACGGGEAVEQLAAAVGGDVLRLSDLFPFIGEEFYLPKPLCPVSREQEGDSVVKKISKSWHTSRPLSGASICGENWIRSGPQSNSRDWAASPCVLWPRPARRRSWTAAICCPTRWGSISSDPEMGCI